MMPLRLDAMLSGCNGSPSMSISDVPALGPTVVIAITATVKDMVIESIIYIYLYIQSS